MMEQVIERSLPVERALLRSAHRLALGAQGLAWLIPPLVVAPFLLLDAATLPVSAGLGVWFQSLAWTSAQRGLAAGVALLPALAVMLALFALARICREYASGHLFSNAVLSAYRRLGAALIATTCLHWLQPTLLGLALSLTVPPGERLLTIGVSSDDLLLVLVTAVVFLLASVMQVAQRVQSENDEIV